MRCIRISSIILHASPQTRGIHDITTCCRATFELGRPAALYFGLSRTRWSLPSSLAYGNVIQIIYLLTLNFPLVSQPTPQPSITPTAQQSAFYVRHALGTCVDELIEPRPYYIKETYADIHTCCDSSPFQDKCRLQAQNDGYSLSSSLDVDSADPPSLHEPIKKPTKQVRKYVSRDRICHF